MIYVAGSGPAGVSCAVALLQQGARVTLLDPGLELEQERSAQLVKLQGIKPEAWQRSDTDFLKKGTAAGVDGIPLKYAYGSDFTYRDPGVDWSLAKEGVDIHPSFAKGGLSTVWGAAVLPYRQNDMKGWPVGERELAPHYGEVFKFMPLAGRHDALEAEFPLHSERTHAPQMSRQAHDFLEDIEASKDGLKRHGIVGGASRLAMWAQTSSGQSGCCYCGQCMYGCPYEMIYCSAHTLPTLCKHPNFTYRKNVSVDRVSESGSEVTLHAHDVITHERLELHGERVFLACGVLATTKILLDSMDAFGRSVTLQDSYYFLLPTLRLKATPGASLEHLHTLSQAFLEIMDPEVSAQTVHLQVYTYNELYATAIRKLFGSSLQFLSRASLRLLDRLILIQGFLSSECSPSIRVTLSRDSHSGKSTLHLAPLANEKTAPTLKRIVRKLKRSYGELRAIPLGPMLRPGKPGRSFHSGGTFPMHAAPAPFQSDVYGRPYGFNLVHAVDSTVLPSVPATTITVSVMANAHRIGTAVGAN